MDIIFELIEKEKKRQENTLMMIPSENYTYPEVFEAVGSVLMQKYAEGYPGKRYYQGNKIVDEVEELCRERALEAFGLNGAASAKGSGEPQWNVNVQPHSGCEANLAVYNGLLEVGDKILAMNLPDGGHLSHGWHVGEKKITLVSKIYEVEFYKVNSETEVFDYDEIEKQAVEFKPEMIISGGTAYPREIDYERMGQIAKKVGAYYLADVSHEAGLIAGGACRSPFPFADVVTMTTHKTLRGPRGGMIFSRKSQITSNKLQANSKSQETNLTIAEAIDRSVFPGIQGGPHLHTIAGIAVALGKTRTDEFKNYTKQTVDNAKKLAEVFARERFETVPYYRVVSGGTDKHLVLIDVGFEKGREVAERLEEVGIVVNKNTIPGEKGSPFRPSGIRMGTQALTVRGMKEGEMERIGRAMISVIHHGGQVSEQITEEKKEEIRKEVGELCREFPVT